MKDQIKMIVFVIIMGIIAAAILVGTDNFTSATISDNKEYALKTNILEAFEISYKVDEVLKVYDETIREETKGGYLIYYTKEGNAGFEFEGRGLWGPIRGFLTLQPDYVTIKGIQITYNEETPGLGGVVAERWYLDKYKGKKFDPEIIIKKDANMTSDVEVDAITGATATSSSFQLMLNKTYQEKKGVLE